MSLPDLPEGYRWRLKRSWNPYVTRGYIDFLQLQKRNFLGFWTTKAQENATSDYGSPERAAGKIMNSYFKTNDPNTKRLGVIK